jgi:hypothetical protein
VAQAESEKKMIHKNRRFSVADAESAEKLAAQLTEYTWCSCNGFQLGELVFLNDSFSENGAQEYAVIYRGDQIESITFGWCTKEQALEFIRDLQKQIAENSFNIYSDASRVATEPAAKHERCQFCA